MSRLTSKQWWLLFALYLAGPVLVSALMLTVIEIGHAVREAKGWTSGTPLSPWVILALALIAFAPYFYVLALEMPDELKRAGQARLAWLFLALKQAGVWPRWIKLIARRVGVK